MSACMKWRDADKPALIPRIERLELALRLAADLLEIREAGQDALGLGRSKIVTSLQKEWKALLEAQPDTGRRDRMTEDEAKQRWCPHVRYPSGTNSAVNRIGVANFGVANFIEEETKCIGSDCMAWRWQDGDPGGGHCGLAGPIR